MGKDVRFLKNVNEESRLFVNDATKMSREIIYKLLKAIV